MRSALLIMCVVTTGCVLDPTPYAPSKPARCATAGDCPTEQAPAEPPANAAAADGVGTTPSGPEH